MLYIKAGAIGGGIGTKLWQAIERQYPDAVSWGLCTLYFKTRDINFCLRKCGFHIVDLLEEDDANGTNTASLEEPTGASYMFK